MSTKWKKGTINDKDSYKNIYGDIMSIKAKIKSLLALEEIKLNELVVLLKEKHNKDILPNTLSKQLNREIIRYKDVEEILDVIGYEIIFQKKK